MKLKVVALGAVDSSLVTPYLPKDTHFVEFPDADDLQSAHAVIARAGVFADAEYLAAMPNLQVIARTGVGVDNVDVELCTKRGIPVVITPGAGTNAVAEGVLALTLHLVKRLGPLTQLVRSGQWAQRVDFPLRDLEGSTIGIVGFGRIGSRVAHLAQAFGMRVLAWDPMNTPPPEYAVSTLDELVSQADVISLHAPATPETFHLVGAELLTRFKPGALLINCARGSLVDLDAALAALNSGQLSGVGLDTYDPEPPSAHPIFSHPDVVLTPHVMGLSNRAMEATFAAAALGVADVLTGTSPKQVANPDWVNFRQEKR